MWKRPVGGPCLARRLNLDGDGQGDLAGHGGVYRAVFVYQLGSYDHWRRELGRDDFEFGQFGENFTVEGLADDQVCVGDRYQIGEALFEVTQPRVTCYRVGIRMNDARMPALLVSHHRPGFYFRVLREGAVQAGDEVVKVAAGEQAMTVAEIDALLYLPGHPREQVERALRIPALSPGWQASFRAIDEAPSSGGPEGSGGAAGNAGLTAVSPPPAWAGFRPLVVAAVDRESSSVISLHLADPHGAALPARPARAVPHPAAGRRRWRQAVAAQLLAVRPARGGFLPDQRQARAARRGQPVRALPGPGRRRAGRGRPARYLRAPAGGGAGPADQRGCRGDSGPGHAARPGRQRIRSRRLVAARGPQPGRGTVRRGVEIPAGRRWPAGTGTSATAGRGPPTSSGAIIRRRVGCRPPC